MRGFINALFIEENKLDFHYMDYDMSFYLGEYRSYYLVFYIKTKEELIKLWEDTGNIFNAIKQNTEIYNVDMDKNTMCIYCLQTTDEEYYETGETGTISELSKKISLIEEDLNYFAKHVFLYTDKMKQFSAQNIGKFDILCKEYLTKENFEQYRNDIRNNYEYDFIINLFIKFPFLKIKKYFMREQEELQYRSVTSFIQEKFNQYKIDLDKVQKDMKTLGAVLDDENALFEWLDQQIVIDESKEENK